MGLSSSKYSCTSTDDVVRFDELSQVEDHRYKAFGTPLLNKSLSLNITKSFFKSSKSKVLPYIEESLPTSLLQLPVTGSVEDNSVACKSLDFIQTACEDTIINKKEEDDEEEEAVDEHRHANPYEPYKFSSYFSFENGDVLFLKISTGNQSTNVPMSTFVGWECFVHQKGVGITRAAKWLSRYLHLLIHFGDGRREFIKVKSDDSKEYSAVDLLNGHLPMNVTFLQRIFKA